MTTELGNVKHSHDELKFVESLGPYVCHGCLEPGLGNLYTCENCNFKLHEACMFPKKTSHEFFSGSTFEFFKTPPNSLVRICNACTMPINGFAYHCQNQNLNLHPICMELKKHYKVRVDDEDLNLKLDKKVRGECMWCKKKNIHSIDPNNNGWSYVSECGKSHLHVACFPQMLIEEEERQEQLRDPAFYNYGGHAKDVNIDLSSEGSISDLIHFLFD